MLSASGVGGEGVLYVDTGLWVTVVVHDGGPEKVSDPGPALALGGPAAKQARNRI